MDKKTHTNRNYQDTVFNTLFSDKENALELFNALEGTNYGPETEVEIRTLENVFYLEQKNDLGVLVDRKYIFMAEHQATINPNIPLRLLGYVSFTFEKLVEREQIYSKRQIKIPTPIFYVFYTGDEDWTVRVLRLSDSYQEEPPENSLELVVKVINLRYNKDNEILQRSKTLAGYSILITKIKDHLGEGLPLEEAINLAVEYCRREGYLTDFLNKYGEEVGKMKFYEFTREEYEKLQYKEGRDDAIITIIFKERREGNSDEKILEKLMNWFDFSKEEAMEYLEYQE